MAWTEQGNILIGDKGERHELSDNFYWYLAPAQVKHVPGRIGRPLEFAMTLHNAFLGEGVMIAMEDLLKGITPSTLKGGAAKEAEETLEKVRRSRFPHLPSRLQCFFLNYDKEVAERRAASMFRTDRKLVRCKLILSSGRYHFADVNIYEKLEGRPDDLALAEQYWMPFRPDKQEERDRLEVLADSALYFPDWREFPQIDQQELMAWAAENPPRVAK